MTKLEQKRLPYGKQKNVIYTNPDVGGHILNHLIVQGQGKRQGVRYNTTFPYTVNFRRKFTIIITLKDTA